MKKGTILFLAMTFIQLASASSISVRSINALLQKNHGLWVARENPISSLSDVEVKRLLGSSEMPTGNALFEDRTKSLESFDWRNVNGVNWLGPVMNQGNCGSCVAFAAVATLEATYRINAALPWLAPTFSPQQLFACGGGACSFGWQPALAATVLKKRGIVDSACAPYESGATGIDMECKEKFCENQVERTYKIADSNKPSSWGGIASKVKKALKKGPLLTTMTVYDDFLVYGSGIYKSISKKKVGGHAVSLVGFNDLERYWIVRNSWGTEWGEKGFIRVSYDDKSGIADSTWAYDTTPEDNYISIAMPEDREYVSGEKKILVNLAKASASEVFISGETDKLTLSACEASSTSCLLSVDTTSLKDGRYEIFAKSAALKSQVREFFVLNHEPKTTIHFAGSTGVELNKPQKGRIEFDIDVTFNPVAPKRVTFFVEDEKGVVVLKRVTEEVVDQMKLGFRTTAVPNGKYIIYYMAETPFQGKVISALSNKEQIVIEN